MFQYIAGEKLLTLEYAPNETGGTAKNPIKTGSLSHRLI